MYKTYILNELANAVVEVEKAHPLNAGAAEYVTDMRLREILEQIQKTAADKIETLSIIFTQKEINTLESYFPQNRFHLSQSTVDKIRRVLQYRMKPELYLRLFHSWENYPGNSDLLKLLADCDRKEMQPEEYPLEPGRITQWNAQAGNLPSLFLMVSYYIVPTRTASGEKYYQAAYRDKKMQQGTTLYRESHYAYLTWCSARAFRTETPNDIRLSLEKVEYSNVKDSIMLNMLNCMGSDRDLLTRFDSCYNLFYQRWKKPDPKNFPAGYISEYQTYVWWYNYQTLIQGFQEDTDPRRLNFWKQQLGHCTVSRIVKSRFIIMDFGNHVVVESEKIGYIYIYTHDYYYQTVQPNLINKTMQLAKYWMNHNGGHVYQKAHLGAWEYDVLQHLRQYHMI